MLCDSEPSILRSSKAVRIQVCGIVQGVGFRPFVYNLATGLQLRGWVRNTSGGVEIAAQGQIEDIEYFLRCLQNEAPALARIDSLVILPEADLSNEIAFTILPSVAQPGSRQPVPPDAAICRNCEQELFDPANRRYLYPFLSCTNCGPRFTIMNDLPCDRQHTVMAAFPFCPECQSEYNNPLDRRFHAQASACPNCGPRVLFWQSDTGINRLSSLESIFKARQLLREGGILAVKGLGGFHLACDAGNAAAVAELRRRKHRPDKPFALMAADIEAVSSVCQVSSAEAELLQSHERPVVLLDKKQPDAFSLVAPKLDKLGFMLPYTPLHHLLLTQTDPILAQYSATPDILVMTSGNRSGEPIIADNEEALAHLQPLADAFLLHDRPILLRCDDSVTQIDPIQPVPIFVRRSRGYVPHLMPLPFASKPLLAVGGELKNTFCIADRQQAFLSQHLGEMEDAATCAVFEQSVAHFSRLFRIQPELVAHDLHPNYFTTRYAQKLDLQKIAVQHHHAHIAACMADNGLSERQVIGLAFDGTGYGPDDKIWGGEILITSYAGFERFAHLEYLPLPGGEAAIRHPWRIALGYTYTLDLDLAGLPFLDKIDKQAASIIKQQVDKRLNAPLTSSIGRLFDAVASLLGICNRVSYEGQAAIELEVLSKPFIASAAAYPYTIDAIIQVKELLKAIIYDLHTKQPIGLIGARFHQTIAWLAIDLCEQARNVTGINEVALSGGVWQNQTLLQLVRKGLTETGFTVYVHQQVPTNDGGLALGQAVVAQAMIER